MKRTIRTILALCMALSLSIGTIAFADGSIKSGTQVPADYSGMVWTYRPQTGPNGEQLVYVTVGVQNVDRFHFFGVNMGYDPSVVSVWDVDTQQVPEDASAAYCIEAARVTPEMGLPDDMVGHRLMDIIFTHNRLDFGTAERPYFTTTFQLDPQAGDKYPTIDLEAGGWQLPKNNRVFDLVSVCFALNDGKTWDDVTKDTFQPIMDGEADEFRYLFPNGAGLYSMNPAVQAANRDSYSSVYKVMLPQEQTETVTISGTYSLKDLQGNNSKNVLMTLYDADGAVAVQKRVRDAESFAFTTFAPSDDRPYALELTSHGYTKARIENIKLNRGDVQVPEEAVLYAGELSGDHMITTQDIALIKAQFGKSEYDFDGDGITTMIDIFICKGHYDKRDQTITMP
jgi:hypothetical protein